MGTESGIRSVKAFMSDCKAKDGAKIAAWVTAADNGEIIHSGAAEVFCSYNFGYMQYSVSILWSFDDLVMRKLGLRGVYNTNFQGFSYSDGNLVIEDDSIEILISKG